MDDARGGVAGLAVPLAAVLLGLLLAGLVSGCGPLRQQEAAGPGPMGGSTAYCDAVEAFDDARSAGPDDTGPLLHAVADAAPDDVASAWRDVAQAYDAYMAVVDADLLDPADPPAGMSADDVEAANVAVLQDALASTLRPVQDDSRRVREHAKQTCGVRPVF